jgi:hypothetical protein
MTTAMVSGNRESWLYTSDDGVDYVVSSKSVYTSGADSAKYGGSQGPSTKFPKDPRMSMRCVKCTGAGGEVAWIPVYDVTAALWTTPGTTVTRNSLGVDVVFTSTAKRRAEKDGRRLITQQS